LDTHIFLWAVSGSSQLKSQARRLISSADDVFISSASIWEIAIKARLGKVSANPDELVLAIDRSGFQELPVRAAHAALAGRLEMHHNDPFDRMLVAQAISEPLRLLTADVALKPYSELVELI
jgi:PIN domain nuclease of toxin-antitoxin system